MSKILRYQTWLNENILFEDDSLAIDWKGKLTGPFDLTKSMIGIGEKKGPNALGISTGSNAKSPLKWSAITPPKSTPPVTTAPQSTPPTFVPSVDFKGTDFPYPDNIITPNWTIAQGAKAMFDGFIINLVEYFKLDPVQAKTNFKSIAVEGAADIANATAEVPAGYTKLDHTYGGAKPSNEFLAENRALKMKEAIVNALTANGGLTPDLVTFVSGKITTTFKTGLPRGERYVKITIAATSYDVKTTGTIIPATTTPGTETPGQVGPSGEKFKTYLVLRDPLLEFFFGNSNDYKIESTAFRPTKTGDSDFRTIKLDALQQWATEYLGGELLSSEDIKKLTLSVDYSQGEASLTFNGVPAGKVIAPISDKINNELNTIYCSEENRRYLSNFGMGLSQNGVMTGFPFILCYQQVGTDSAILKMHSVQIGRQNEMFAGLPFIKM